MREIEFRGKRTDTGEWVYGNLWHNDAETMIIEQPSTNEYDVDENTVGQYTGLKDRNGKKIFEGDIIKYGSEKYLIRFVDGAFCYSETRFKRFYPTAIADSEYGILCEYCEIIGNQWDNPELKGKVK